MVEEDGNNLTSIPWQFGVNTNNDMQDNVQDNSSEKWSDTETIKNRLPECKFLYYLNI